MAGGLSEVGDERALPIGTDYLGRATSAVTYLAQARGDVDRGLALAVQMFMDVLAARSASLWTIGEDGRWTCTGSAFGGPPLPPGYASWESLSLASLHSSEVICIPHGGPDSLRHFAAPCVWPTHSISVLHVLAEVPDVQVPIAAEFLELIASILIAFAAEPDKPLAPTQSAQFGLPLTDRQEVILRLMETSLSYQEIAKQVGYSESTVKQEAGRIFQRLGAVDRASAVELGKRRDSS